MKSKIIILGLFNVIPICVLAFGFICCKSMPGDQNEPVNTSLNGVWDRGDIIITINNDESVFTQINSGPWQSVFNNGLIKIGDKQLINITQTDNLIWSASVLTWEARGKNDNKSYTLGEWQNCIIVMNENGKSMHITVGVQTNPKEIFTRVEAVPKPQ